MNETMTTNKYFEWVDWAKVIGIYLMVLGHGGLVNADIRQFIFSFHMPLFFVLSGFLHKQRSFIETFKKNIRALLVPYLIMNGILLLYNLSIQIIAGTLTLEYLISRLGAIFLGLGYNTESWIPLSTPLWFLIALFIIQTIVSLGRTQVMRYCIMFLSIAVFVFLDIMDLDILIPIDSAMLALPFFVFGCEFKSFIGKQYSVYLLPVLLFAMVIINHYNGRVDINTCKYGNSLLLTYLGGILGTLLTVNVSRYLQGGVKRYASGLLLIVGFNLLAIMLAKKIWNLFFPEIEITSLVGAVIAIFICFAFAPIIEFCKRYFSMVLGNR